jgi:hypothetical protein
MKIRLTIYFITFFLGFGAQQSNAQVLGKLWESCVSFFSSKGDDLASACVKGSDEAINYVANLYTKYPVTFNNKISTVLGKELRYFSRVNYIEANNKVVLEINQTGFLRDFQAVEMAVEWGRKLGLNNVKAYPSYYSNTGELYSVSMYGDVTETFANLLIMTP